MRNMVEEMAQEMAQPGDWHRFSPRARTAYRLMARAALTRLMDPTDAMVNAGDRIGDATCQAVFRAMIRAALDEDLD